MKVIGIDPGSRICGYGILEAGDNRSVKHLTSGCISASPTLSIDKRLHKIYTELSKVIQKFSPDIMSIENVFFSRNAKSAIKLGEARGIALLAAADCGIAVFEYAPTQVKLALTGRGRANKQEVQRIVGAIFDIQHFEKHDVSDAIAMALCHIHFKEVEKKWGTEILRSRRRRVRFSLDDIAS